MGDQYKLVSTSRKVQLFDIGEDPAEKEDLSGKLEEQKKQMEKELAAWKAGVMKELKAVGN